MKESKIFVLILIFVLNAFSQASFAQSEKAGKIDEFIAPIVKAGHFAGVILAAENGKVIYEKAFGLANADYKISNQLNTRIGIASITKPMTVVILARLVEEKKIALDDKLSKYIPDFPSGDKITIEMLVRHRSGILHRVMPPEQETVNYTPAEFIEKVKQAKLAFEPGTERLYSSGGFAVLARVLEIASRKTYQKLLQEYVFAPAGMTDSVDFTGRMIMERRAQDYFISPDGLVNAPLKDYSFLVGAGSVYSTARDVYRFGEVVLEGRYGETAKKNLVGETALSASGSTNGHRAYLEIDKDKKYGFVILSNLAGTFDMISQGVKEILLGKEVTIKNFNVPKIIPNPNKNLSEFAGRYKRDGSGNEIEIVLKNDLLHSGDIKLYPIKTDCFFEYRFYGEVCFVRDESGKIKHINWASPGLTSMWVRQ